MSHRYNTRSRGENPASPAPINTSDPEPVDGLLGELIESYLPGGDNQDPSIVDLDSYLLGETAADNSQNFTEHAGDIWEEYDERPTVVDNSPPDDIELCQLMAQHVYTQDQHMLAQNHQMEIISERVIGLEKTVENLRDQMPIMSLLLQPPPPPTPRTHSPVTAPSPTTKKRRLEDEGFVEPSAKRLRTIEFPLNRIILPFLLCAGMELKVIWLISSVFDVCPERSSCSYQTFTQRVHLEKCFEAVHNVFVCKSQMEMTKNINRLKEHCVLAITQNSYIYVHSSYYADKVVIGFCCNGSISENMVIDRSMLPELEFALMNNNFNNYVVKCQQNNYAFL